MSEPLASTPILRFGCFELDPERGVLRRQEGRRLPLAPQPLRVLELLAERSGELVGRDELQRVVWGTDTFVDFERGLASCIHQIRQVLGDSAAAPRYVETLPRRGYRLLAPVERVARPRLASVASFPGAARVAAGSRPASGGGGSVAGPVPFDPRAVVPGAGARLALAGEAGGPEATPAEPSVNRPVGARSPRSWRHRSLLTGLALAVGAAAVAALWWWAGLDGNGEVAGGGEVPIRQLVPDGRDASRQGVVADGRLRLVVLPFTDDSASSSAPELGDGFTEEVVARLGALDPDRLGVLARGSVAALLARGKGGIEVARELSAGLLLEGGVRLDDDRLRVTTRLIEVATGTQLWSAMSDHDPGDLLAAQERVASTLARALAVRLEAPARPVEVPGRVAQAAYLAGRGALARAQANSAADDLAKADQALTEATLRAPRWAAPWAARAELAALAPFLGGGGWDPAAAAEQVDALAARALALDSTESSAHFALAIAALYFRHDRAVAREGFERAMALRPGSARVRHWYAGWFAADGRHREALALLADAETLDPLAPSVLADVGWFSFYAGELAAAERACGRVGELAPEVAVGWACLVAVRRQAGDLAAAWQTERRRLGLRADGSIVLAELDALAPADALVAADRTRLAHAAAHPDAVSALQTAAAAVAVGELGTACGWLVRAIDARDPWVLFARVDPRLAPLLADPQCAPTVERLP